MKAMVLAAGEGQRLRPLTDEVPKPMLPLAGRPLLEYTIGWLRRYGIDEVIINLHHQPESIRRHFGDGSKFGVRIAYSDEPQLLGTAGALRPVAHCFSGGTFFIIYGDNLSSCDLSRLLAFHLKKRATATIAVFEREDVTQSGMVVLDEDGRVVRFHEKPSAAEACSPWVSAGIIAAEPSLLGYVSEQPPCDLGRDVFPLALAAGESLYAYRMTEGLWWVDSMEEYRRVNELMARGAISL